MSSLYPVIPKLISDLYKEFYEKQIKISWTHDHSLLSDLFVDVIYNKCMKTCDLERLDIKRLLVFIYNRWIIWDTYTDIMNDIYSHPQMQNTYDKICYAIFKRYCFKVWDRENINQKNINKDFISLEFI